MLLLGGRGFLIAEKCLCSFPWHGSVQNFGADVNVFIDHSQIVQLACVRKGIWGKSDLFNRVVTFKDDYYADESRGLEASCAFALLH